MKNYSKTIQRTNGNGQKYTSGIPMLVISKFGNDVARKRFENETGLQLRDMGNVYCAQPKTFKQLYKCFACYNWKTTYYNNASDKNTLKLEHNI